jgi:hypothetical protein
MTWSFCSVLLTKYHSTDKVKKSEMGRTFGTYGGEVHKGLKWENLREEDHLEDPDVDRRMILKWIFERLDGGLRLDQSGSG